VKAREKNGLNNNEFGGRAAPLEPKIKTKQGGEVRYSKCIKKKRRGRWTE